MSTVTIAQFKDERLNITYKLLQTGENYQIRYKFVNQYSVNDWRHEIESFSGPHAAMDSWKIRVDITQKDPKCTPELFEAAQVAFDKANIYLFGHEENTKSQDEAIDLLANAAPDELIYESHEEQAQG